MERTPLCRIVCRSVIASFGKEGTRGLKISKTYFIAFLVILSWWVQFTNLCLKIPELLGSWIFSHGDWEPSRYEALPSEGSRDLFASLYDNIELWLLLPGEAKDSCWTEPCELHVALSQLVLVIIPAPERQLRMKSASALAFLLICLCESMFCTSTLHGDL